MSTRNRLMHVVSQIYVRHHPGD